MKNIFDSPKPLFGIDPDHFEDIGAALTVGSSSVLASPSPAGTTNMTGLTSHDGSIYALWRVAHGNSLVVRKYSAAGVYDPSGDIPIQKPTVAPSGYVTGNFLGTRGITFYNNKIYVSTIWNRSSPLRASSYISRYSLTGTFEANVLTLPPASRVDDIDIGNDNLIVSMRTGTSNNFRASPFQFSFRIYNLDGTPSCTITTSSIGAVVITPQRIYLNENCNAKAYDTSYNRVSADDFTTSHVYRCGTAIGSTYYGLDINNSDADTIYRWTGIPQPAVAPTFSVTLGSPSYTGSTRAISTIVTFPNGDPDSFSRTGFKVEKRSGSVGSYTWADDSRWVITSGFDVLRRVITATPSDLVESGTYRITLIANGLSTNQPSAAVSTDGQEICPHPPVIASFGGVDYTAYTRAISSTITFTPQPKTFSVSAFKVQKQNGAIWVDQTTGWTITAGSGTTSRLITATPDNTVQSGTYRITLPANSLIPNQPRAAANSASQSICAPVPRLVAGTSSTLTGPPGGNNMTALASDGQDLYALWRIGFGVTVTLLIRKYSADGVYDPTGDITIVKPRVAPSGFTASQFTGLRGMAFYNNQIYFASLWRSSSTNRSYVLKYNLDGRLDDSDPPNIFSFELPSTSITDDIDIDNNGNVIISMTVGSAYSFKIYTIDGTERQSISSSTAAVGAIVISESRIYLNEGANLKTYNTRTCYTTDTPCGMPLEDFNTTRVYRVGTSIGDTYYGLDISSHTVYRWSRIPFPNSPPTITASFSCPTAIDTRSFHTTITFSSEPRLFTTSAFKIQKRFGSAGAYNWRDDDINEWIIIAALGTTVRELTVIPLDSVETETYRIVLPDNSLKLIETDQIGQPSADAVSEGSLVNPIRSTFGKPIYNNVTRAIKLEITYNPVPRSFSTTGFTIQKASGPVGSYTWNPETIGWTLTSTENGSIRTIIATPDSTVSIGIYRMKLAVGSLSPNQPSVCSYTNLVVLANAPISLTSDGSIQFPRPAGYFTTGITDHDGSIYILWEWWGRRHTSTGYIIRKYSPDGVHDSDGDISITYPSAAPSGLFRRNDLAWTYGFAIYENKIYTGTHWRNNSVTRIELSSSISTLTRSNLSFTTPGTKTINSDSNITAVGSTPTDTWDLTWSGDLSTSEFNALNLTIIGLSPNPTVDSIYNPTLSTISRYSIDDSNPTNITSTYEGIQITVGPMERMEGFDISDDIIVLAIGAGVNNFTGSLTRSVRAYDFSTGRLIQDISTDSVHGVAKSEVRNSTELLTIFEPPRIYLSLISGNRIRVYDGETYNLISTAETTSTSDNFRSIAVLKDTFYGISRSGYVTSYKGVPLRPIFASFGAISLNNPTDRVISATITFTEAPLSFNSDAFKVQKRSGLVGSYTWCNEPLATVNLIIRIILDRSISALAISNLDFGNPTTLPTGRSISSISAVGPISTDTWDITFNEFLTDIEITNLDITIIGLNPNPEVSSINHGDPSLWEISTGTGTTSREITARPSRSVSNSIYRIMLPADGLGTNQPVTDISTTGQAVDLVVATATWSNVSFISGINGKLQGTITFRGWDTINGVKIFDLSIIRIHLSSSISTLAPENLDFGTTRPSSKTVASLSPVGSIPSDIWDLTFRIIQDPVPDPPIIVDLTISEISALQITITGLTTNPAVTRIYPRSIFTVIDDSTPPVEQDIHFTSGRDSTKWKFDSISTSSVREGSGVAIKAQPPDNINGSFGLRLKAESIKSGGSTSTNNAPADNVDTELTITASWSNIPTGTQSSATITATLTFTQEVPRNELSFTDFTVTQGGSITGISGASDQSYTAYTITITQPTNYDGTYTVSLKAGAIATAGTTYSGGPIRAITTGNIDCDTRSAITASWSNVPTGEQTSATITATLIFNHAVPRNQLHVTNDFTVTNGGSVSTISGSAGQSYTAYTITITQPTNYDGNYTVSLDADAVATGTTYLEGPDNAVSTGNIDCDTRPQLTVNRFVPITTSTSGSRITSGTTTFTLDFSLAVPRSELTTDDFTVNDVTGSGVTVTGISETTGSHSSYTITITHPTNATGSYTVVIDANAIPDATGYKGGPTANYPAAPVTAYYNVPAVIATAVWSSTSFTNNKLQGTITFSGANVTGLETGDFAVINSSNVEQTGWTIELPTGVTTANTGVGVVIKADPPDHLNESFSLRLKGTSVRSDGSTADNAPAANIDFDNDVPVDTRASITATWSTITGTQTSATITPTLTFNQAIPRCQLSSTDFTVTNGGSVSTISGSTDQSYTAYTITITQPTNYDGHYTVSLNADAIPDGTTYLEGPDNAVSTGNIDCDTRSAITASWSNVPTGEQTSATITATLTFNHAVPWDQLHVTNDFTVTNGGSVSTISGSTGQSYTAYTITITQPTNYDGNYTVTLISDAIPNGTTYLEGPDNALSTGNLDCDTRSAIDVTGFILTPTPPSSTTSSTATREFNITFNMSVPADQLAVGNFASSNSDVTISSVSPTTGSQSTYTITVNQPENNSGNYTISLNANAIAAANTYLAGPVSGDNEREVSSSYDRRSVITIDTFAAPTNTSEAPLTGATIDLDLDFDLEVPRCQLRNSDFTLSNGATISSISGISGQSYTDYTITVTQPTDYDGTYTVAFNMNTIESSTTYLRGPAAASTITINCDTRSATWNPTTPLYNTTTRAISSTITFSSAPSEFETDGFQVDKRSGAGTPGDPYIWTEETVGWTITAGSGTTSRLITATPANTVSPGTYRITLPANGFGDDGPASAASTSGLAIGLIAGTTSTLTGPIANLTNQCTGIATYNGDLYAVWRVNFGRQFAVSKNSLAGVHDTGTGGTITVAAPTTLPTGFAANDFVTFRGIEVDNNKIYLNSWWRNASTERCVVARYSITGTFEALEVQTQGTNRPDDISIKGDEMIITLRNSSVAPFTYSAVVYTRTGGTWGTTPTRIITLTTAEAAAFSESRIYLGEGTTLKSYDTSYNYISDEDTTVSTAFRAGAVWKYTFYGLDITNTIHRYLGVPYTRIVATATWSSVSFTGGKLTGTLTFSGADVTGITACDFVVLDSSDNEVSWTFDTPDTTATAGSGITISATPPANTNGTFKLRLKQTSVNSDGGTDNSPASNVDSSAVEIDIRSAIDVQSFGLMPQTTTSGSTATREFQLVLSTAVPKTQITPSDFEVPSGITIASVTGLGQAISTSVYTVLVNQPINSRGSYTVALKLNAIAAGTTYLAGPISGDTQRETSSTLYDRRSAINVTGFELRTGTSTTSSSSTREFTLTFNLDVPRDQLDTTDFTITNVTGSGVTLASISGTSGTSYRSYTITVNQPSDTTGSYTVALDANSVIASDTYLAGPVSGDSERTTASTTYDTRSAINVISFALRTGSSTTAESSTREFTLTFNLDVPKDQLDTTDFTITNITGSGVMVSSVSGTSGTSYRSYTIIVNQPSDLTGSYTIALDANSIDAANTYLAGPVSGDLERTTSSTSYNTRSAITATWSGEPTGTETGATVTATLTFGQSVPKDELTNTDFEGTNGASVSSISGTAGQSYTAYTITITQPTSGNGSYTISLKVNSVPNENTYLQGPVAAVTSDPIAYDRRSAISVTSFTRPSAPSATDRTHTFTLVLNHTIPAAQLSVPDFTLTDTETSGSGRGSPTITSISPSSGNVSTYTIVVTPPTLETGHFTLALRANSIQQTSSTAYLTGPSSAVTAHADGSPTVTTTSYNQVPAVVATAAWSNPEYTSGKLQGDLTFSITSPNTTTSITDITTSDFAVVNPSGMEQSGWVFDSITTPQIAETAFKVAATPPTSPILNTRFFSLRLKGTSVRSDGSARNNAPAANVDFTSAVPVDTRTAITAQWGTLPVGTQTSQTIDLSLTFGQSITVSGLTTGDFSITGGTGGSVTGVSESGGTYTITVTQPTNYDGTYTVSLDADAIPDGTTYLEGPDNAVTTGDIDCDTRTAIGATWGPVPTEEQETPTIILILTFDREVLREHISENDFIGTNGAVVTGINGTSGSSLQIYEITITQPPNSRSTYTITLDAGSIPNGITYLRGPSTDQTTCPIPYNTVRSNQAMKIADIGPPPVVQDGWTFEISGDTTPDTIIPEGTERTISAVAPPNTQGHFKLRIKPTSVRPLDKAIKDMPKIPIVSGSILMDTREAEVFWSEVSGGTVLTAVLNLRNNDEKILTTTNDNYDKIEVVNGQSGWILSTVRIQLTDKVTGLTSSDISFGTPLPTGVALTEVIPIGESNTNNWDLVFSRTLTATERMSLTTLSITLSADFSGITVSAVIQNRTFKITSNGSIIIALAPPENTVGNFALRLTKDAISVGTPIDNLDTEIRFINNLILTLTNPTGGSILRSQVTNSSNRILYNFDSTSFEVVSKDGQTLEEWSTEPLFSNLPDGQSGTVIAVPPDNINGSFKIRLRSFSSGTLYNNPNSPPTDSDIFKTKNTPVDIIESGLVSIQSMQISWINIRGGSSLLATLSFSGDIQDLRISNMQDEDFEIRDSNNIKQSGWVKGFPSFGTSDFGFPFNIQSTLNLGFSNSTGVDEYYRLRLKRSSLGLQGSRNNHLPKTNLDSSLVHIQNIVITWINTSTDRSNLTWNLNFNSQVSNQITISDIQSTDIQLLDSNNNPVESGISLSVSTSNISISSSGSSNLSITISSLNVFDSRYKLRLKAKSLTAGSEIPRIDTDTGLVRMRNIVIRWSNARPLGNDLEATLTLDSKMSINISINGFQFSNLEILDNNNNVQTGWRSTYSGFGHSIPISPNSSSDQGPFYITPPPSTNGQFRIRLRSNSLTVNNQSIPLENEDSCLVTITRP